MSENKLQELTDREIHELSEEIEAQDKWREIIHWATEYYGPTAHSVDIETGAESDDEGGSYPTIHDVSVKDKDSNELEILDNEREDQCQNDKYGLPAVWGTYVVDKPPKRSFPVVWALKEVTE